jgi:branched-chain amino acid transport system substrate-binding protein
VVPAALLAGVLSLLSVLEVLMMRRCSAVVSLVLLVFAFLSVTGCAPKEEVITLGCLCPLTGEGATYGRATRSGVELAVEEINTQKLLPKRLEVIFEDDKMAPKDGNNAFRKLVNLDKVPLVIGPFGSSIVLAVAPTANETKTVIVSASATADQIADAGDYVFRIVPPNSKQGADLAKFSLGKLGAQRAAILYQTNDYGLTLKDAFDVTFREGGGEVVGMEGYPLGATDYRGALTKIKPLAPDVIFFPLHQKEAALMLRQAKELGLDCAFVSADGAYTNDLIEAAGNAAEGSYYSTMALAFGEADAAIEKFNADFRAKFNKEPDVYSAYYYEVTMLIAQVIREHGASSEELRTGLQAITGDQAYHGITGTTAFDDKGEVNKAFYVYQVQGGTFQVVGAPE